MASNANQNPTAGASNATVAGISRKKKLPKNAPGNKTDPSDDEWVVGEENGDTENVVNLEEDENIENVEEDGGFPILDGFEGPIFEYVDEPVGGDDEGGNEQDEGDEDGDEAGDDDGDEREGDDYVVDMTDC